MSLGRHLTLVSRLPHITFAFLRPVACHPWEICSFLTYRPTFLRSCAFLRCHLSPLTCFHATGLSHSHAWFFLVCRLSPLTGLLFPSMSFFSRDILSRAWLVTCHVCSSIVCHLPSKTGMHIAGSSVAPPDMLSRARSSLAFRLPILTCCLYSVTIFLVPDLSSAIPDILAPQELFPCRSRHVRLFLSCSLQTLTFPSIPGKPFPYAYVYRSLAYCLSPLTGLREHDLSSMKFLCVSASLDKFAIYG